MRKISQHYEQDHLAAFSLENSCTHHNTCKKVASLDYVMLALVTINYSSYQNRNPAISELSIIKSCYPASIVPMISITLTLYTL